MKINTNLETIEVTDIDENVEWTDGIHINFIQWVPGGQDDVMIIHNGNQPDDPVCFYNWASSPNIDLPRYFYGAKVKVYIKYSECILTAGHKLIIQTMPIGGSFIR